MNESRSSIAQPSSFARSWTSDAATFLVVVGTAAAWGHTIDDIRIGELSAIPAGFLNLGLLAAWIVSARDRVLGWHFYSARSGRSLSFRTTYCHSCRG